MMPTDDHIDEQDIDLDTDPEEVEETPEEGLIPGVQPASEIDPEIENEIKKVIVEEEPVKKAQMLPDQLIYKELEPDDLFDPGSI
jgi:hypothetical protein